MNAEQVRALIARGEGQNLEFKKSLMQRRPTAFERRPVVGATLSDLDEEKLRRYFARRAPGAEDLDRLSLADLALGQGFMVLLYDEETAGRCVEYAQRLCTFVESQIS